ncbi:DNA-binding transcriptional regulator GbsR (MarR family) [Methanohalophilus levihalophilus]|uniref:winged helix-turn-helix domain-containing protein n=1 Tax=Methanohalophilus levihalophilus TaxID=1431282 RepID=UPI001AE82303|nr:winged helix-turn-helix domain-containing protein [Methanohalophilus levihalophilus]MBP2029352.1 DNA-binding transcriptional regulator GbsR (MarR family) [Methanohalophilus levihalophilus]
MEPFEDLLGNSCELRLIEFLLPLEGLEFNITELADEVSISRPTATKVVQKFIEWNLLTFKRTGNVKYYSINTKSPIIASIQNFNNAIIETMLGEDALYEIHDYANEKKIAKAGNYYQDEREKDVGKSVPTTSEQNIPTPLIWGDHPASFGGMRSQDSIFGGI